MLEGFRRMVATLELCGLGEKGFGMYSTPLSHLTALTETVPPPPLTTTDGSTSLLDPVAYPVILDTIISHSDHRTRTALWGVSKALYHHLNSHFYRHISKRCRLIQQFGALKLPIVYDDDRIGIEIANNLERYCRIFDVEGTCDMDGVKWQLGKARGLLTLRACNYHELDFEMGNDFAFGIDSEDEAEDKSEADEEGGDHSDSLRRGSATPSLQDISMSAPEDQNGATYPNDHTATAPTEHASNTASTEHPNDAAPTEHASDDANHNKAGEHSSDATSSVSDGQADDAASEDSYEWDVPFKLPPTIVLKASLFPRSWSPTDWTYYYIFLPHGVPAGPERLVLNIAYTWTSQIFASTVGPVVLPKSLKELVFHFKKTGDERPRYMLCKAVEDDEGNHGHQCVEALSLDAPIPTLEDGHHLDLVHHLTPGKGIDIFQHIVNICAKRVASGNLKVTLVGVDEFDAGRDLDAAGDDAFEAMIDTLPWGHPVHPREVYEHPAYEPVADTIIDRFLKLVDQSKHEHVKKAVKVLSTEEYLGQLGQQRREEEAWWALEFLQPCSSEPEPE